MKKPAVNFAVNEIAIGDVLATLRTWPTNFVQTVITSPPYWGLRDYGIEGQIGLEPTPARFIAKMVRVFRQVRRVLKNDGTLWLNLGDSYSDGRIGRGDQGRVQLDGYPRRGAGAARRRQRPAGVKPKDLVGIPWLVALALRDDGWYLRSDIIWAKPNPMPESVSDRPTKSHEYLFLLSKSENYFYDAEAIKEQSVTGDLRRPYGSQGAWDMDGRPEEQRHGGEQRFPTGWQAGEHGHRDLTGRYKNGKVRSPAGWKTGKGSHGSFHEDGREKEVTYTDQVFAMRNKRSVWTIPTQPFAAAHFATFPEDLIMPCVKAGSREGDVVLDPFMGSGTVAVVAKRFKREWLGIEINPAYAEIARRRIGAEEPALLVE